MNLGSVISGVSQKLTGQKQEPVENYVALKIGIKSLTATSWKIENGKVEMGLVAISPRTSDTLEDLINVSDESISKVTAGLVPEPQKIIFGVSENWVEAGKIKPDHLANLRQVCKKLGLRPMGFVTVSEAVDNFLREVEGVPMTAILVGIDHSELQVTILRAGKNFGSFVEPFEGDIGSGLEKAIRRFPDVEFLPSRIIIYDGKSDLEDWKEKIISYPWTQRLPFLHFPKVEILPAEDVVKAVAIAGGTQLGGTLDPNSIDWGKNEEKEPDWKPMEAIGASMEEDTQTIFENTSSEPEPKLEPAHMDNVTQVSPEEFGFAMQQSSPGPVLTELPQPTRPVVEPYSNLVSPKVNIGSMFSNFKSKISLPKLSLRKVPEPGMAPKKSLKMPFLVSGIVLFLLLVGGAGAYYLPKAQVTVFVSTKSLSKTMDLSVSLTGGSASSAAASITGKAVETSLSETKKGVASGKKLVGDKAHGQVTIYSVSDSKTFAASTVLTSPDGLKFSLDSETKVASGDAVTPATITAAVTASDIGDKYNLSSGTKLTIGSSSTSYLAKNDAAFTGGASHQATVVTKDDQNRLSATVSAELQGKARDDLNSKLGPGETLLDNAITSSVASKKFSKDVDAEAESLTLDMTIKFTGVVFDQKEAAQAFKDAVSAEIPSGFDMNVDSVKGDLVKVTPQKNGSFLLTMSFSGQALPIISGDKIKTDITGKSAGEAKKIIASLSGVDDSVITYTPKFWSNIKMLPFAADHITIDMVSR